MEMIEKRATRTGDGSVIKTNEQNGNEKIDDTNDNKMYWGWNDDQLPNEYKIDALKPKHM